LYSFTSEMNKKKQIHVSCLRITYFLITEFACELVNNNVKVACVTTLKYFLNSSQSELLIFSHKIIITKYIKTFLLLNL